MASMDIVWGNLFKFVEAFLAVVMSAKLKSSLCLFMGDQRDLYDSTSPIVIATQEEMQRFMKEHEGEWHEGLPPNGPR